MEDIENLLKGTVAELDKLLNARNVLGEPIKGEGATVIPMVSFGFGFGVGGGVGEKMGAGAGAGGGIKPIGAIIIDKSGARVESVKGTATAIAANMADIARKALDKVGKSDKDDKED